jgi:hypothetical protein
MIAPVCINPSPEGIPAELKQLERWVVWQISKDGKKVPFSAQTGRPISITTSGGVSFSVAMATYTNSDRFAGLGLILNGDGLIGIDLDGCVQNGVADTAALAILETIGCQYVELSPSGRGLHGFGYADTRVKGIRGSLGEVRIEVYGNARYLTVTGRRYSGYQFSGGISELSGLADLITEISSKSPTYAKYDPYAFKVFQANKAIPLASKDIISSLPIAAIPQQYGTRNDCVFHFARYVKAIRPDAKEEELYSLVSEWVAMHNDNIKTKDVGTTWGDFWTAWDRIEHPYGHTLEAALSKAIELPGFMRNHRYGDKGNKLLGICCSLAKDRAPQPFYLSSRVAEQLTGIDQSDCAKFFNAFRKDGYLIRVREGTRGRAAYYAVPEITDFNQEELTHE